MDETLRNAIADYCAAEFKLPREAVAKFLGGKTTRQGEAFWRNRSQFAPAVLAVGAKDRLLRFFDLINFLGTQLPRLEGALEMVRAYWLLRFNRIFRCSWLSIRSGARKSDDAGVLVQLVNEIVDARVFETEAFQHYVDVHGDQAVPSLYDLRQSWVAQGRPSTGLYLLAATLHRHGIDLRKLSGQTCADFQHLIHVHPPTARFKGFGHWGSGDAADKQVATNIFAHFRKHVCDAGAKRLTWPDECALWWGELAIELPRARLDLVPVNQGRAACIACFDGAPVLPMARVTAFLAAAHDELMRPGSELMRWLVDAYAIKYRDKALAFARRLEGAAVFMERGAVYVSGFCGRFYVIGRVDAGVLAISSCYVAENMEQKLAARELLWQFDV